MSHNYVDGQVYKFTEEWMIFQVNENGELEEDEEYTEDQIKAIIEKFGITKDTVVFNPVIIPVGTEVIKLPDSEKCKSETEDCCKELEFKLSDLDVVIKLSIECPYTSHMLEEMLA